MKHWTTIQRGAAMLVAAALVFATLPSAAQQHGDLSALRRHALELVNESRRKHDFDRLRLDPKLNEAAQRHAEDMLKRHYYSHQSPEGETVQDRFEEAGGSKWKVVAENIARCQNCPPPPDRGRIEELHEGWMNSPGHRANILREGLKSFGFGIVMGEGRLYAVQTFAGPGVPRGVTDAGDLRPVDAAAATEIAVEMINDARRAEGREALRYVAAFRQAAQDMLPSPSDESFTVERAGLQQVLRTAGPAFRSVGMLQGICGGCGERPVAADARYFIEQWLKKSAYRERLLGAKVGGIGLAIAASGKGKKIGVLFYGETR